MIKYSSIDIIKRAEQLADLENSDFISDYEKLALLNENWSILYQKIINSGDKTFIKKISVTNGMKLPADFYQLSDIYTKQNHDPITRKSAIQFEGYDIVDGRFVLSKDYNNVSVIAEYFPAPQTLYLKNKTKDSDYSTNTVACNGSLYYTEDNQILDLYDPDVSTTAQFTSDNVAMFNNGAISYDYVDKDGIQTIECQGSYYPIHGAYKGSYDSINGINYYYGNNPGIILGDEISIIFPETPILYVSDYATIDDVANAGYCPTYVCNNTNGHICMSKVRANVLKTEEHGNVSLVTTTDINQIYTSVSNLNHVLKISFTYNGTSYTLDGVLDTDKGRSVFTFAPNGTTLATFYSYKSDTYTAQFGYTATTDFTITDLVTYVVNTDIIWAPELYADNGAFEWVVSSDSFSKAASILSFQSVISSTAIPGEPTSETTGWSSQELAMQVFLYDANEMATAFQEENSYVPFIIDNELYMMDKTTNKVVDFYNNEYDTLGITFTSAPSWIYTNKGYDTLYAVYENQIQYYNRLELVATYNCDEFKGKAFLRGKALYGVTTGYKLIKCKDTVDILETKYIPVTIIDGSNVLTHKPMTNRYFVEGTVENTVLDFSNNISYIMLSYLLAIAFKSKQGADTALLSNQLAVAEQQFYDSINKDINGQYTVKNVYKNRRYL